MSFSKIPPLSAKSPSSDPFEIFSRRPSLAGTPNDLWGGQRDALQQWAAARNKRDVLISLNTGSGKTMLGVLIAQSMANEKDGKCVYVCSTIDLVTQTVKEAKKLGISPTTRQSGSFNNTDFEQGKTFCITTYSSVFNAQRPFKRHNATKFVFDDAHVAEKAIRDAFTLTVSRLERPSLFAKIIGLLAPVFSAAGQSFKFREIMTQRDTGIVLVPPMLALEVADTISSEISQIDLGKNQDLLFPYLYLKDHIKLCAITVSADCVEISPPFLPASTTHPFAQEDMRRVYLSATLQTQAEFARAFGRRPDIIIAPETDAGNGERCILFGQYVPQEDSGPKLAEIVKSEHKLVIACRSYSEARTWEKLALVPKREEFSSELDKFRDAATGAFVLVGRVDGIDLPDDVCRVMIIDGLPSGYTQVERFQIEYCAMTSLAATKLASRITQVFGRINRGRKDYGVFILRGRALNNWLGDAENTALLPELLQKQLLLGDQVSNLMIRNKTSVEIVDVINLVMARNLEWIETYGDRIANADLSAIARASAKEKDSLLTDAAISEAQAIHEAWNGEFATASAALSDTADKVAIADTRLAGWHNLWLGWFYQLAGDQGAAEAEYTRARARLGNAVFLPRIVAPLQLGGHKMTLRGSRLFDLLSEDRASRFEKEFQVISRRLAPLAASSSTSAQHEEATRALGEALGFVASRPDNVFRTGPDVLWIDEEEKCCILFELKTLQQGPKPITKTIVSKGHDHLQWVRDNHNHLEIIGLIFIAESVECKFDANPSAEMCVGPLGILQEFASSFLNDIRSIRNSLPLERLTKVSGYVEDSRQNLSGIKSKIGVYNLHDDNR